MLLAHFCIQIVTGLLGNPSMNCLINLISDYEVADELYLVIKTLCLLDVMALPRSSLDLCRLSIFTILSG